MNETEKISLTPEVFIKIFFCTQELGDTQASLFLSDPQLFVG